MADDDQRDGQSVTPEGTGTTSTPVSSTPGRTGQNDRRTTKRPVRSAPIRRGRSTSKKSSGPTPPVEAPAVGTPIEESPAEEVPAEKPTISAVSLAKPAADPEIAPDPSDVEKTVSYRERRRARQASSSPGKATGDAKVRYRGSGRRSPRAVVGVVIAIVVIVVCAVASVVFALGIARQDEQNDLRSEYSAFASQVLINLTSMNPETVDQTLKSVQEDTSGKVKEEVQNNIQQVASLVRDGKLETKSIILSSAVTKAEPDEGSVIMVFGWHQQSLDGQTPAQDKVFRWRVDMTRINGDLKMTDFEWVA
ncbi:Mce-associated membrane protein [Gordonia westfalica]|uniref:Mce-associated membrane protein n=1 Tax=Gordonia westfalica TaxID=158898 RepID=A0A1H2LLZ4_9ACTN|nr:Mce-associated membrane protein [Gordonia westfalica]